MIPNRVVLDTNVCLDLFVFHDARWASMLAALKERKIEAVTRDDCRSEWIAVLDYPHLPVDAESRPVSVAMYDQLIVCLAPHMLPASGTRLPVCTDRDDQKFLELARDACASVLVTKDKALLKLAKKTARDGLFRILTPDAWVRDYSPAERLE